MTFLAHRSRRLATLLGILSFVSLALVAKSAFADPVNVGGCPASASVNDRCLVHLRSVHMRSHPQDAWNAECMGIRVFEDPQPAGHPMPMTECDKRTRQDQIRLGLPTTGLSDELKAAYRRTWGNR